MNANPARRTERRDRSAEGGSGPRRVNARELEAQVIVLNGGSSSGKTSIARALQESLPGTWLTFGVDTFIEALPGRGDSLKSGISYGPDGTVVVTEQYKRLERAWYSALHTLAHSGANIILDEVLLSGGEGQRRLQSAFDGVPMLWVGVRCDLEVAAARECSRGDRVPGMARLQASRVHDGVVYDIEIDTTARYPEACAQLLADFVTSKRYSPVETE